MPETANTLLIVGQVIPAWFRMIAHSIDWATLMEYAPFLTIELEYLRALQRIRADMVSTILRFAVVHCAVTPVIAVLIGCAVAAMCCKRSGVQVKEALKPAFIGACTNLIALALLLLPLLGINTTIRDIVLP